MQMDQTCWPVFEGHNELFEESRIFLLPTINMAFNDQNISFSNYSSKHCIPYCRLPVLIAKVLCDTNSVIKVNYRVPPTIRIKYYVSFPLHAFQRPFGQLFKNTNRFMQLREAVNSPGKKIPMIKM